LTKNKQKQAKQANGCFDFLRKQANGCLSLKTPFFSRFQKEKVT